MKSKFTELFDRINRTKKHRVAIACADNDRVLQACDQVRKLYNAEIVLVGNAAKTRAIADSLSVSLTDFSLIDEADPVKAAGKAAELVHSGQAEIYMKGILPTKPFLQAVLDPVHGLTNGNLLSHVAVMDLPSFDRLLFMSDVGFIPYPTVEQKKQMIRYCTDIARACGVTMPKAAPLAAVEVVNPKMPATIDAEALRLANQAGEITGCIVDGPLSLDLALFKDAAEEKEASDRPCAGCADILIFPDIQAGNLVYKTMAHLVPGIQEAGILVGTDQPVIVTSRSDTVEAKVNSLALAFYLLDQGFFGRR